MTEEERMELRNIEQERMIEILESLLEGAEEKREEALNSGFRIAEGLAYTYAYLALESGIQYLIDILKKD